jgi:hypothetical protein
MDGIVINKLGNLNSVNLNYQENEEHIIKEDYIKIYTTEDYSVFKKSSSNRNIVQSHVNALVKSFEKDGILSNCVIEVNEKYEVIDGHHRLEALKVLNMPVKYKIVEGYGVDEIKILNNTRKNWDKNAWLSSYINQGIDSYIKYEEFKKSFSFLTDTLARTLLAGTFNKYSPSLFKNGKFEIKDYNEAVRRANHIKMLEDIFPEGYNNENFCLALNRMYWNPEFDFEILLKKIKTRNYLKKCVTLLEYTNLIDRQYNYKVQPNKKIFLVNPERFLKKGEK